MSLALFFAVLSCTSQKVNTTSNNYNTDKITISKNPCFGFCPTYTIDILKNGKVYLNAKDHVKNNLKGNYTSELTAEGKKNLANLNLEGLKEKYGERNVSDLPSTDVEISFTGGIVQKTNDYGNHGTKELEKLYGFIDSLIENQKWEKVND
ncbi:hypothetical protein BB021_17545 [Elizabethkingia ursingii]|uniref:DUF6438 domain-containing protein n=1 Tax=Elizabethkingia ursingii TaxID=1756150 RepID=A0ABX3NI54_9FLAO|nr:hypothetical protein BB021_17545 [Elizabethkingia ursingii]